MLVNTYYENKVDQLRDVVKRLDAALTTAGIRYTKCHRRIRRFFPMWIASIR